MSGLHTFSDIIYDQEDRFFKVPPYQRGYSWNSENREDLFNDLKDLNSSHGEDYKHFTGTIVASYSDDDGFYYIVDGQQRLTSIIILLSRIYHFCTQNNFSPIPELDQNDFWEKYIQRNTNTGNSSYKLELINEETSFYPEILNGKEIDDHRFSPKTKTEQNLKNAAIEFANHISNHEEISIHRLTENILHRLGFLLYTPNNDKELGLMFEVINNRGKPLSELEKVKNYLIYLSNKNSWKSLSEKISKSWGDIIRNLNSINFTENSDEHRFLRNARIVYGDYTKSGSKEIYEGLKEQYPPYDSNPNELNDFVDFLKNSSDTLQRLLNSPNNLGQDPEEPFLEKLAFHPGRASVLPIILALFEKETNPQKRAETLEIIEKLNFRYYVCETANRNDSDQGHLFGLAYDYYWGNLESENNETETQILQRHLNEFIKRKTNTKKFIKQLLINPEEGGNIYHWRGLKLFLALYERALRNQKNQSMPLKHIMGSRDPNNTNDNFQKEHIFSIQDYSITEYDDDFNKTRLGNFVLIREGTNKGIGNLSVEEKVNGGYKSYKSGELFQLEELEDFYNKSENYVKEHLKRKYRTANYRYELFQRMFDLREESLINFAINEWGMPELEEESKTINIDTFEYGNEIFTIAQQ